MKPEKPKTPPPPPLVRGSSYDALLEPLPVPDVVESDSDTAWGLWEDSLHPRNDESLDSSEADTQPMGLTELDPKKPPDRDA